jgi:hypothetical protein
MTTITFKSTPEMVAAYPHPKPAKKIVPEWYKEMPQVIPEYKRCHEVEEGHDYNIKPNGEFDFILGMKACPPIRDLLTSGYIIPLWTTMYLSRDSENHSIYYAWPDRALEVLGEHNLSQTEGCPFQAEFESTGANKFMCPWNVYTPKGYSTLFMPVYYEGQPFEILPAIVDTDVMHEVNFPFRYRGEDGKHKIDRGAPLVHAIPFRREEYKHSIEELKSNELKIQRMKIFSYGSRFYQKIKAKKIFR